LVEGLPSKWSIMICQIRSCLSNEASTWFGTLCDRYTREQTWKLEVVQVQGCLAVVGLPCYVVSTLPLRKVNELRDGEGQYPISNETNRKRVGKNGRRLKVSGCFLGPKISASTCQRIKGKEPRHCCNGRKHDVRSCTAR
jgi:hypothetical protein